MAVPLSYSLPAFTPDGYSAAADQLAALRQLGFRQVTLHPTFAVRDTDPLIIRTDNAPPVAQVVAAAHELGLKVRLEPHLDYEQTLKGQYKWRASMRVDPLGDYFDKVLQPMFECGPDELTLGSELDDSTREFPYRWRYAAGELSGQGVDLGHKLNHDWDGDIGWSTRAGVERYLETLDYQAVSFYTPEPWKLDERWTIGEFGLGTPDITKPWAFDAPFQDPHDPVRRDWYLRFLTWLKGREGRAASFWTVAQYDVLGILDERWRDDAIVNAVRDYNAHASP